MAVPFDSLRRSQLVVSCNVAWRAVEHTQASAHISLLIATFSVKTLSGGGDVNVRLSLAENQRVQSYKREHRMEFSNARSLNCGSVGPQMTALCSVLLLFRLLYHISHVCLRVHRGYAHRLFSLFHAAAVSACLQFMFGRSSVCNTQLFNLYRLAAEATSTQQRIRVLVVVVVHITACTIIEI